MNSRVLLRMKVKEPLLHFLYVLFTDARACRFLDLRLLFTFHGIPLKTPQFALTGLS